MSGICCWRLALPLLWRLQGTNREALAPYTLRQQARPRDNQRSQCAYILARRLCKLHEMKTNHFDNYGVCAYPNPSPLRRPAWQLGARCHTSCAIHFYKLLSTSFCVYTCVHAVYTARKLRQAQSIKPHSAHRRDHRLLSTSACVCSYPSPRYGLPNPRCHTRSCPQAPWSAPTLAPAHKTGLPDTPGRSLSCYKLLSTSSCVFV